MSRWAYGAGGAVAGAAITWLAMQGAGSASAASGTASPAGAVAAIEASTAPLPGEAPDDTIARLRSRVGDLQRQLDATREELQASKVQGAVASGQLSALQGTPIAWPDDVPDALRPEGFEAGLRAAIAPIEGAKVVEVDCSEYPCIGVVELPGIGGDAVHDAVGGVRQRLSEGPWKELGEDMAAMLSVSSVADEQGERVVLGVGAAAAGFDQIPDADTRTRYRMDSLTQP
jgi:hypothetical protein